MTLQHLLLVILFKIVSTISIKNSLMTLNFSYQRTIVQWNIFHIIWRNNNSVVYLWWYVKIKHFFLTETKIFNVEFSLPTDSKIFFFQAAGHGNGISYIFPCTSCAEKLVFRLQIIYGKSCIISLNKYWNPFRCLHQKNKT